MIVNPNGIRNLADADDFGGEPGALTDGYVKFWDNTENRFDLKEVSGGVTDHGELTGRGDDDHTQYLLVTGERDGASSQAQKFTNGVGIGDVTAAALCHVNFNYSSLPVGFNVNQHLLLLSRQNANVSIALSAGIAGYCSIAMGDANDVNACEFKYTNSTGVLKIDVEDTVSLDSVVVGPTFVGGTGIKFHVNAAVWSNPAGFNANSDLFVIGRQTSTCGMLIQADTDTVGYVYIGDVDDKDAGGIKYDNDSDTLTLRAGGTDQVDIADGVFVLKDLPTSDPTNAGQIWNDSGTLKVSAG